ncbi:hypothetical protein D3C74_183450 [compost metagenome]
MHILSYSYILGALYLPVLFLIFNHPNRYIRWITRSILIGTIFYLIAVVPFVVLTELKYWALLLAVIPIIFRIISLVLDKIGFFSSKSSKIVENLLYASVAALSIIFVGASSNTLEKLFFLIVILLVLYISDFQILEKYKYMGTLFGPLIAVIPTYDNFNVFFTVVAIWLVMTITLDLILKLLNIKKSKHIERSTLIVFITVSIIIANNGGIQLEWTLTFLKFLTFLVCVCFLMGSSFIINEKVKNVYVRQFSPVIISSSFLVFLHIMVSRYNGVKYFFNSFLTLIIFFCLFISLNRLISPLAKLSDTNSFPLKMSSINETMNLIFGKKLGQAFFNNLFGVDFRKIHFGISLFLFALYLIAGVSIVQIGFPDLNIGTIFQDEDTILAFVTANSMIAALVVIGEIMRISSNSHSKNGLSKEDALHSSTIITLEYFFTFVPLLAINIKDIYQFLIIIGVFLLAFYANINMTLYLDFQQAQFNNFKKIRLVLTVFFYLVSIACAPLIFFLEYDNQGFLFFSQYNSIIFALSFFSMFLAKLLGYDTEFGSRRAYKWSWFKLIFLFISISLMARILPLIMYLIVQDENQAIYISVLCIIILIAMFGQEWAMVLLPWSNHSKKTIIHDWMSMFKSIKARNGNNSIKTLKKSRKTNKK